MNEKSTQSTDQSPAMRVLMREAWPRLLLVTFSNVAGSPKG